jgi:hypothetical protein
MKGELPHQPVVVQREEGSTDALLCASRPSRYVSEINDNHLVSLMNFIATKVN